MGGERKFHIIVKDYHYRPNVEQQQAVDHFFKNMFSDYNEPWTVLLEQPELIGIDYQEIQCPQCHKIMQLFDDQTDDYVTQYGRWWDNIPYESFENPETSILTMPCCQAEIPLISVQFPDGGGGFTRFQMCVTDPTGSDYWTGDAALGDCYYGCELKPETLHTIENLIGSPVTCIWES